MLTREAQTPVGQREVVGQEPGQNERDEDQHGLKRADEPRVLAQKSFCEM